MQDTVLYVRPETTLVDDIQSLLGDLGNVRIDGIAYDSAWVGRLALHYPANGFDAALEWLRRNQYEDGTWGAPLLHYHDRFISTLAAIVALREVGGDSRDERRVKRGENALWRLVGGLGRDDSDTIGFPLLAATLAAEAASLGLEVPNPPIRFAKLYRMKVKALLNNPQRNWLSSTLSYSFEGLRGALRPDDQVLETNDSVASSPAATAAYLMMRHDEGAVNYLKTVMAQDASSGIATFSPIDIFDVIWPLYYLNFVGAIQLDSPEICALLEPVWQAWDPVRGIGTSTRFTIPDLDDTAACYTILKLAGFPVEADVFAYFEMDEHFCCYLGETNPALSANVRLLLALQLCEDHPQHQRWVEKALNTLQQYDSNGSFWWDKWHASPYYVTGAAIIALHKVAIELAAPRVTWLLRTQNDDGGWGYLGESTPEETAYCLMALLFWDDKVKRIDDYVLTAAAQYLSQHVQADRFAPLWIGKGLYTPHNPVKSAVLAAMYYYMNR